MNYSAMIQNRRSVRAFREKEVPSEAIGQLRSYYEKTCPRLVPEIATELIVLDKDAQPALESSAGYLLLSFMYFITQHPITMTGSTVRKPRSPTRTFASITSPANHAAKVKTVAQP